MWGRYPMGLKMESGVCSESIMGSDKGLKSCTVGWERESILGATLLVG